MHYINQLHRALASIGRMTEPDLERFCEACRFHIELAEFDFIYGDRDTAVAQKRKALNALYQARELLALFDRQTAA